MVMFIDILVQQRVAVDFVFYCDVVGLMIQCMNRALRLKRALTWQKFVVKLFKISMKQKATKDASSHTGGEKQK